MYSDKPTYILTPLLNYSVQYMNVKSVNAFATTSNCHQNPTLNTLYPTTKIGIDVLKPFFAVHQRRDVHYCIYSRVHNLNKHFQQRRYHVNKICCELSMLVCLGVMCVLRVSEGVCCV